MRNNSSDFHKSRWYVQQPREKILSFFSTFNPTPPYNVHNTTVFHWYSAPYLKTVTLVTAKNQHRCWKARAARTRARVLSSLLTSLFPFAWATTWLSHRFRVLLIGENSKIEISEKNIVTFLRFFHSFLQFEPIYYRGLVVKKAMHNARSSQRKTRD